MARQASTPDQLAGDEQHKAAERDYWRRSLNVSKWAATISFGALVSAGFAAWFAWGAYDAARDQTRRALRAYVVVEAELQAGADAERAGVLFTADNMGQTPVYNFEVISFDRMFSGPLDRLPATERQRIDCGIVGQPGHVGSTFGKKGEVRRDLNPAVAAPAELDAAFDGGKALVVYGAGCYRDIFGAVHAAPVCFVWWSGKEGPKQCRYDGP